MNNKFLVTTLIIVGLIFGVIGLILCFFPLGTIDIVPASIGFAFGLIAFLIARKTGYKRKLILSVLVISVLAIIISLFSEIFIENKVAEDQEFEEKIEQSEQDSVDDLEEALEDIDEIEVED